MRYEWLCEHVIVLDVCYTIKRPTTMCLAIIIFVNVMMGMSYDCVY